MPQEDISYRANYNIYDLFPDIGEPETFLNEALENGEIDVETLYKKIGIGLRDYDRPSVI